MITQRVYCCAWLVAFSLAGTGPAATRLAAQEQAENADEAVKSALTTIDPEIPLDQLKVMVKPLTKSELDVEADAWFQLLRAKARQIAAVRLGVKKTSLAESAPDEESAQESLQQATAVKETADAEAEKAEEDLTKAAQENLGIESSADGADAEQSSDETANDDSTNEEPTSDPTPSDADQSADNSETGASAEGGDTAETAAAMKEELLEDVNVLQDERTAVSDRLAIVLDSLERKGGDVEEFRNYASAVAGIELDTSDASATWAGIVGWVTSKEGGQRLAWNLGKFVLILVVTYLVAKVIAAVVNWLLERKIKLTQLAERLIASMIKNLVMLVGFAIALTALEIDITPVIAAIGATGLVVGLALQGTLSNFASGLMILINRPFDVGHVVTAGGVTGTVNQMNLVSTTFRTFDNQTIHVPNNEIWGNVITNITANPTRRVDMEFGIGYDDDFEQAEQIIKDVVTEHELVLSDPEPMVVTHALGDSSVNIVCRPWSATSDWWRVKTDVTREVKRRFDQADISIPYPQQDVHVYNVADSAEAVAHAAR